MQELDGHEKDGLSELKKWSFALLWFRVFKKLGNTSMNKFNAGDTIYWFEGPDQCLIVSLDDLQLRQCKYTGQDDNYLWTKRGGLIKRDNNSYYKTKNEAIDAMIKRLEGMRE